MAFWIISSLMDLQQLLADLHAGNVALVLLPWIDLDSWYARI